MSKVPLLSKSSKLPPARTTTDAPSRSPLSSASGDKGGRTRSQPEAQTGNTHSKIGFRGGIERSEPVALDTRAPESSDEHQRAPDDSDRGCEPPQATHSTAPGREKHQRRRSESEASSIGERTLIELDESVGGMRLNEKPTKGKPGRDDETSFSTVDLDINATDTPSIGAPASEKSRKAHEKSTSRRSTTRSERTSTTSVPSSSASQGKSAPYTVSTQRPTASSAQLATIAESPREARESVSDTRLETPKPKNATPRDSLTTEPKMSYGTKAVATTTTSTRSVSSRSNQLQQRGLQVLERAALRDELLTAVANGTFKGISSVIQKIPKDATDWPSYFPQEVPDVAHQKLWGTLSASRFLLPRREQLATYIQYVQDRALGKSQAETFLLRDTKMMRRLLPVNSMCIAFRDTPETQLLDRSKWFEFLIKSALDQPNGSIETIVLEDMLALQPWVGIRTLADKCAVLQGHVDEACLKELLSILKRAGKEAATAFTSMVRELIAEDVSLPLLFDFAHKHLAYSLTGARHDGVKVRGKLAEDGLEKLRDMIKMYHEGTAWDRYDFEAIVHAEAQLSKAL